MICLSLISPMILAFFQPKKVCDFLKFCRIYADIGLALLTASALTNHRRLHSAPITGRPRAQSNVSLPTSRMQPFSPITTQTTSRLPQTASPRLPRRNQSFNHSANLMSTPPPNRALARQLKLKGSLTDPAQPRRREAFGAVRFFPSYIVLKLMHFVNYLGFYLVTKYRPSKLKHEPNIRI